MALEILIVDDEADIRSQISGILEDEGFETREAANSTEALAAVAARQPSLVVLDVWLNNSDQDGLQILEQVLRNHPSLPVIMISGHATFDMAVSATKIGAYDFISKPFKVDVLLHAVNRALEGARLRRENEALKEMTGAAALELVGESTAIREVRKTIARIAETESRVLLIGAAGTGKTLAARIIHKRSPRHAGPFVVANCAGMTEGELYRLLFGAEASGDSPRQVGAFEEAHGGTLLIDEVADIPPTLQGKLVRLLHQKQFRRLGGTSDVNVDVRVLSATNQDLKALMKDGRFRDDLYYRLGVVTLVIPPLSKRRGDIPMLLNHLARRSRAMRGGSERSLSEEAIAALQAHDWPGNVWELANVLERLLILTPGGPEEPIEAEAVAATLNEGKGSGLLGWSSAPEVMNHPLREAREAFEKEYLLFHLARLGGNISRTANFIGMDRAALHRKLKGLGIHQQGQASADNSDLAADGGKS